jgi:glycosyltransferase involved in cell wall biosynthesis
MGARRLFAGASYACYVTSEALQKRYPCAGRTEACSDVEIQRIDDSAVINRRPIAQDGPIRIGTTASLDVAIKGLTVSTEALSRLHPRSLERVTYELVGLGTGVAIEEKAQDLGVQEHIRLMGGLPHAKVFDWLDKIDIYVQPSYQEGLCRSIVEAMSRACPVIATDVGGNYELVDREWLVPAGDADALALSMQRMIDHPELAAEQGRRNFEKTKEFDKRILDAKRDAFYREFVGTAV